MSTKSTTMMPPMLRSRSWRATSSHASRLFADMDKEGNRNRKSTRLNSSHLGISYAVFCLKKKKNCLACPSGAVESLLKKFECCASPPGLPLQPAQSFHTLHAAPEGGGSSISLNVLALPGI